MHTGQVLYVEYLNVFKSFRPVLLVAPAYKVVVYLAALISPYNEYQDVVLSPSLHDSFIRTAFFIRKIIKILNLEANAYRKSVLRVLTI
jgi:hypothetical protein